MKKTTFEVHTYIEHRVFTGLKYLILYGCNAYPKPDHEIASVDDTAYKRVKCKVGGEGSLKEQFQKYMFFSLSGKRIIALE